MTAKFEQVMCGGDQLPLGLARGKARLEKLLTPRTTFICPNTGSGSMICERWPCRARPSSLASRAFISSTARTIRALPFGFLAVGHEAKSGHPPPRRHLWRQYDVRRLDFFQGDSHRRQLMSYCLVAVGVAGDARNERENRPGAAFRWPRRPLDEGWRLIAGLTIKGGCRCWTRVRS